MADGGVVVLGVGNSLKADDAAGPVVAETLRKRFPDRVFDTGQVPENFVGPVRRAAPDAIVLVDAADFGGEPGEVRVVSAADVRGLTIGTHATPLSMFMTTISEETGARAYLVAIQAKSTALGGTMCGEVSESVRRIVSELEGLLERRVDK